MNRPTRVWAVCDHTPRAGERVTLEDGSLAEITRAGKIACRGVYADVEGSIELLILVRIPQYRG